MTYLYVDCFKHTFQIPDRMVFCSLSILSGPFQLFLEKKHETCSEKSSRALFGRDRGEESRLDLAQGFQVGLEGH